ncbi:MAG TPA: hypothetical protein EYP98_21825 [Planctomycetes bacterium]|nr:hypothetical protein [Planctomycetota bacterium]
MLLVDQLAQGTLQSATAKAVRALVVLLTGKLDQSRGCCRSRDWRARWRGPVGSFDRLRSGFGVSSGSGAKSSRLFSPLYSEPIDEGSRGRGCVTVVTIG